MIQKSTFAIGLAVILVGTAGFTLGRPGNSIPGLSDSQYLIRQSEQDFESKTWNATLGADRVQHIRIELEIGEVQLVAARRDDVRIDVTKKIKRPLDSDERQWLNQDWIQAKRDGDTIVLSEVPSLKPRMTNLKKGHQMDIVAKVSIPSGLDVDVSVSAGGVQMSGNYRSVKGQVDAGKISTNDFRCDQKLDLNLDAGDIQASLETMPRQNSTIDVSVGKIALDLKDNASLDASVDIGKIEVDGESKDNPKGMGAHQEIQVGSGGPKMSLKVSAGAIKLAHGKTTRRFDSDDTMDFDSVLSDQSDHDKDISKEIDSAMKEAQSAAQQAMREAAKELEKVKADDQFKIEFDREMSGDVHKQVEQAMKEAQKATRQALEQAQKALEQAHRESGRSLKFDFDKEVSPHMKEIIEESMKAARKAMQLAQQEIQKALEKSSKELKHESI